jgi:hypothetical protein
MKYSLILLALIILVLIPSSVYAWPEPKYIKADFLKWSDSGVQWTNEVRTALIIDKNPVPPSLDAIQAGRWWLASPSARPRLAQLYGVPEDIAKQYGAFYLDIKSNTRYGYPAGFQSSTKVDW